MAKWLQFVPFYAFFRAAPTVTDIAFTNLQDAILAQRDVELSLIEAKAEVTKRKMIHNYLRAQA